jgi:hypothetical protein
MQAGDFAQTEKKTNSFPEKPCTLSVLNADLNDF